MIILYIRHTIKLFSSISLKDIDHFLDTLNLAVKFSLCMQCVSVIRSWYGVVSKPHTIENFSLYAYLFIHLSFSKPYKYQKYAFEKGDF